MFYVKVNGVIYPATVTGKMIDSEWDGRQSKSITLEMSHDEALNVFIDDITWSILQETTTQVPQYDETGNIITDETGNVVFEQTTVTDEFDNSDFNIAGDIIDHRDGRVTIKMGKLTDLEITLGLLLGGDE